MYQKRFNNRRKPFSSDSHGGQKQHSERRGGFSDGRGRRFSSRGTFKNAPTGSYINPSKFVNKSAPQAAEAAFVPQHQFADFPINEKLKSAIIQKGYKTPTPIQDKAIVPALHGKDVVGIANTGTGKTAAFLIPLIHKVLNDRSQRVLIIVPTRELAIQIDQELRGFTPDMRIYSVVCVGGASMGPQLSQLRRNNNFIIGTPGRLKDFINRGAIKLGVFQTVVLDEADRMLDMGFIGDMRLVMQGMSKNRHTLFFSATLLPEIKNLVHEFLHDPVHISVKTGDTSKNVDQDIVKIPPGASKVDVLHTLLAGKEFNKVLVFGRTKHGVEKLSRTLSQRGVLAESIHGNKSHSQRQRALKSFKNNDVRVLVATDVAARGLDIDNVSHVINFDIPVTYEDYVHRIGRTGRGENKGVALTFVE